MSLFPFGQRSNVTSLFVSFRFVPFRSLSVSSSSVSITIKTDDEIGHKLYYTELLFTFPATVSAVEVGLSERDAFPFEEERESIRMRVPSND